MAEVVFEQSVEEGEGVSQAQEGVKQNTERKSQCSEVGVCQVCLRKHKTSQ